MKTKVTYIISNIDKALAFEWISELINKQNIELSFLLLNKSNSDLEKYLINNGFVVNRISYQNKFDIPKALIGTIYFLIKNKTNVVHTHLFDANLIGLLAAWLCRIKKRIYTRHHSSYHHDYFPNAVKYDKFCNWLATDIIAITEIVKEILQKKEAVPEEKIHLIHHGFKLDSFYNVPIEEVELLKSKYISSRFYPVVGVISRYTEWKGVQYIIPAFRNILKQFPNAKLVLANARGDYSNEIKELLKDIPVKNYVEIEFENNLFALYKLFDVFVHVPIDKYAEAFGQIYVEALASSIPSVFSISGIANDFIINRHNALVVDYKSSKSIHDAIIEIITNKDLSNKLTQNGISDVEQLFPIYRMIQSLELLYLKAHYEK